LRNTFESSACQLQCSGRLLSWRTTTSTRLKSDSCKGSCGSHPCRQTVPDHRV
jgi:hypothetical protein